MDYNDDNTIIIVEESKLSRKKVIFVMGFLSILAAFAVIRTFFADDGLEKETGIEIQDSCVQIDVKGMHRKIKLPTIYIDGEAEISNLVTEQIYNEVIPEDFGKYYPGVVDEEIQYESEIVNENIISIHFSGYRSYWGSYEDCTKGLNFDLQTGRRISLSDYYMLSDIKAIIEDAREANEIGVDIPLTEEGIEEEIDQFVQLFDSDEYISRTDVFFLKDNQIYFIVPWSDSMKGSMYVELSIDKFDKLLETNKSSEESGQEIIGEIRHTIVGDVEVIEKSFCAEDSVADMDGIGGTQLVTTWDMKYPYFRGEHLWFLKRVNDSIFEFVITQAFDGPREVIHDIEQTYEIAYMDERFVSVLFEGGTSEAMSYSSYSRGMNFDLKTEEILSMEDFYTWPEWEKLMEDAMEQEQLSVQILEGYMEIDGEERKEYLEEYFIPLFQEDSYIKQDNTYFYIKGGYLYFIAPPYPSCKQDTYVKWEVPLEIKDNV
ncbi:MAG: hypothetical protein K2O15_15000 [Lachnospiraceae bacterium]|nr:hypothetical protein [Lachnospiraceae bacterium]